MPKKIPEIKPLPEGKVPEYGVSGVTPEQEQTIRQIVGDIAPDVYPTGGIAFLPEEQYQKTASQITKQGRFGNNLIGRGDNAQESWGSQGSTHLGDGFSVRSMGRTWLNARLLNDPKKLREVLSHELGHFAAKDASEDAADNVKDKVYLPRLKYQEQLTKDIGNATPMHTLNYGLPLVAAPPAAAEQPVDPQTLNPLSVSAGMRKLKTP